MKKTKKQKPRMWTEFEEKKLIAMKKEGALTNKGIARKLNRTESSIESKMKVLRRKRKR